MCTHTLSLSESLSALPLVSPRANTLSHTQNANTKQGQAVGFKLSALSRMSAAKSVDTKHTLLTFLIETLHETHKDKETNPYVPFYDEMTSVPAAARIDPAQLADVIGKLKTSVTSVNKEIKAAKSSER